jgi:tetratricopeptide (TPR) repeat protein
MKLTLHFLITLGVLNCAGFASAAPRDIVPTNDRQVIEILPPRVRTSAPTPEAAALAARQAITLARKTSDVRYLGRAQATLQRWWDKADAPVELAVLQATVQQIRHEFAAAKSVLVAALARTPQHAQGWLTLATIKRLSGNYSDASKACAAVERAGAALYANACLLETGSLQGQSDAARSGFSALLRQSTEGGVQAWLWSLIGENEERAGRDAAALKAYQTSLALAPDSYTALASADLLLRTNRASAAVQVLAQEAQSDAVLLRRAYAAKLQNQAAWQDMAKQLKERITALDQRGDDPATHARERALMHLWLDADGLSALQSAKLNLTLQKEPFDWWLAIQSAQLATQPDEIQNLKRQISVLGLKDARLEK